MNRNNDFNSGVFNAPEARRILELATYRLPSWCIYTSIGIRAVQVTLIALVISAAFQNSGTPIVIELLATWLQPIFIELALTMLSLATALLWRRLHPIAPSLFLIINITGAAYNSYKLGAFVDSLDITELAKQQLATTLHFGNWLSLVIAEAGALLLAFNGTNIVDAFRAVRENVSPVDEQKETEAVNEFGSFEYLIPPQFIDEVKNIRFEKPKVIGRAVRHRIDGRGTEEVVEIDGEIRLEKNIISTIRKYISNLNLDKGTRENNLSGIARSLYILNFASGCKLRETRTTNGRIDAERIAPDLF